MAQRVQNIHVSIYSAIVIYYSSDNLLILYVSYKVHLNGHDIRLALLIGMVKLLGDKKTIVLSRTQQNLLYPATELALHGHSGACLAQQWHER